MDGPPGILQGREEAFPEEEVPSPAPDMKEVSRVDDDAPPPELLASSPPLASTETPVLTSEVPPALPWDDPDFQVGLPGETEREQDLLRGMVRSILETGPEALQHATLLAASDEPARQVAGLALHAGVRSVEERGDLADTAPEVVLGAVELSRDLFGEGPSRELLQHWVNQVGAQAAGELAHELLLQAELPFGGGSTALALMQQVNDPAAILVGLRGFVADEELDVLTRTEALVLLRDRMEFEAYQEFVRTTAEKAREEGDLWAISVQRLKERVEGPPPVMSAPLALDRPFVEAAFARPYPAMVRDLELFLRHQAAAERIAPDPEGVAALRDIVKTLQDTPISEPEHAALLRVGRMIDEW